MTQLDFSVVWAAVPYLLEGLSFSLMLTAFAFAVGLMIGTIFALILHFRIRGLALIVKTYVAVIRSIPLIMVLFWFFFLAPIAVGWFLQAGRPVPIGAKWTALITFALFEAAYYCEIIRVGLRSVAKGQFEAAEALSLSTFNAYWYVIMPQVFRTSTPIILTQTIILFQDSSLVYVLSLTDLLGAASKLAQVSGRLVEFYLVVAVVYLVICFMASLCVNHLRKRMSALHSQT